VNSDNLSGLFNDANDLVKAAEKISQEVSPEYKHSVYLYFISRYLVSLFETTIQELPVQVWNDYRNALDHFMRYISNPGQNQAQLKKMEGHIQRAGLDICKFICIKAIEKTEDRIKQETTECLRLVDNGRMYDDILTKMDTVRNSLKKAKFRDSSLGESANHDKEVFFMYMEPAFEALSIFDIFSNKQSAITKVANELVKQKELAIQCAVQEKENEYKSSWYSPTEIKKGILQNIVWLLLGAGGLWIVQLFFG
jgi:predicted DNA-binding protein (UPF0251 family)